MGMTRQAATCEAHYTEVCHAVPPHPKRTKSSSKSGGAVMSRLSEPADKQKRCPEVLFWVVSSD